MCMELEKCYIYEATLPRRLLTRLFLPPYLLDTPPSNTPVLLFFKSLYMFLSFSLSTYHLSENIGPVFSVNSTEL